jgi:hypothetical protein
MGKIKLEGNPPYALPMVQTVTARAEGAVIDAGRPIGILVLPSSPMGAICTAPLATILVPN